VLSKTYATYAFTVKFGHSYVLATTIFQTASELPYCAELPHCAEKKNAFSMSPNGAHLRTHVGRVMAQAVSRRPPTAEPRVRCLVSPCGICGGQSGIGTGFSPNSSVFPRQFHSTGSPLLGKGQKIIIIIIFITGLHNKPRGCGASLAPAAGPFTT
jgi:hypothetical protein